MRLVDLLQSLLGIEPAKAVPIDYDAAGLIITPCPDCPDWQAEVVLDDDRGPLVREWHRISCRIVSDWSEA